MEDQLFSMDTKNALESCPKLYAQDGKGLNAIAYVRFHIPEINYEWFITEYDSEQKIAFGFANLNDPQNAELGYISINELMEIERFKVIRDISFTPKKVKDIIKSI